MINIGDRVKFVSDTGVGIVRSIKNGVAQVDVDGFEIPALVSDIVISPIEEEQMARQKIGPSQVFKPNTFGKKKSVGFGKLAIDDEFEDEPIDVIALKRQFAATQKALVNDQEPTEKPIKIQQYKQKDYVLKLLFVPTTLDKLPQEADLDLYLVNDCSYEVAYAIGKWEREGYITAMANGTIENDEKIKITTFKRAQLNNVVNICVSLLPFKSENYTLQNVSQTNVELHPLKFVRENNYCENEYFEQSAFCFTLVDNSNQK